MDLKVLSYPSLSFLTWIYFIIQPGDEFMQGLGMPLYSVPCLSLSLSLFLLMAGINIDRDG